MYAIRGSRRGLGWGLGAAGGVSDLLASAAARWGVPLSIVSAVAWTESRYNQSALSPKGAIGVMQLMPGTASDLGVNPYDVTQNVDGGVHLLQQLYARYGDWNTALRAYNGGSGNVDRGTVSSAARSYATSVLQRAGALDTTPALVVPGAPVDDSIMVTLDELAGGDAVEELGQLSTAAKIGLALAGASLLALVLAD